ncbi:MAG: hypothetical protein AAFQ68_07930, partial [Bacteroidota bacterium]
MMFLQLLRFELSFHLRRPLFGLLCLAYAAFGYAFTALSYRVPNMPPNTPYVSANILALMSLGGIVSACLLAANAMTRDREYQMESFIFSSGIDKSALLGSRFLGVVLSNFLCFFATFLGITLALVQANIIGEELQSFQFETYLRPLVFLVMPNLWFSSVILTIVAGLSRKRAATYLGGLVLYIAYMLSAMIMKAPWIASASPPTEAETIWAARLDPFGLSAFWKLTLNWSLNQRQTEMIAMESYLLHNRIIWLSFSILLLLLGYQLYRFRLQSSRASKQIKASPTPPPLSMKAIRAFPRSTKWYQSLLSLTRIEHRLLWRSWSWWVFLLLWTFVIAIESYNAPRGGTRLEDSLALSSLMANNIKGALPFFAIIGILIFTQIHLWRSRMQNFSAILDSQAISNAQFVGSKLIALSQIPLLMLSIAIVISVGLQLLKGASLDIAPYFRLFYYLGLPLLGTLILAVFSQTIIPNRFLGFGLSIFVLLIASSGLAKLFSLDHFAIQYLRVIQQEASEMNGYGAFAQAFDLQMLYAAVLSLLWTILAIVFHPRGLSRRLNLSKQMRWGIGLSTGVGGGFLALLLYLSASQPGVPQGEKQEAWQVQYEKKYRNKEIGLRPGIEHIGAVIALYPAQNHYEVHATYELCNPHEEAIDSIWLALAQESKLDSIQMEGAELALSDEAFGMHLFRLQPPMQAGESRKLSATFQSAWSPFGGFTPFNAIIGNGSFMRISRYFPQLGYQHSWQMNDPEKRSAAGLGPAPQLIPLEDPPLRPAYQDFCLWDFTISTEKDQTVIASGQLQKAWQDEERSFFQYRASRPGPFRFAL